ncbi:MAG: Mur ligase family protein [Thiovulaceae bacterium]|nr:Mur ligase family protein [Sulfurimonadaceae bacterium]
MLSKFLDVKPLYYDQIDHERMPCIYKKIKSALPTPKIIHLIGTNGKGTTGRFLASALLKKGLQVGHYTSPHILKFNERIWLNGADVSDEILENTHKKLFALLEKSDADALSYFEYTTFLAMMVFAECDYVVLEAGLGGEYDATAVFPKELTLFTPIDFDHTAFLGESIEKIATTKLNAMQKTAIVGLQKHSEVYEIAKEIAFHKDTKLIFLKEGDESFQINISAISEAMDLPKYLSDNLALAACALEKLGFEFNADDFKDARLFGRLTQIAPNILLDVGHNALAAQAIAKTLEGQKFTLIYNTYKDKDFKAILTLLMPIIDKVELLDVSDSRIVERSFLVQTLQELKLTCKPHEAIQEDKNYLVFGSFSVAETFLKEWQKL